MNLKMRARALVVVVALHALLLIGPPAVLLVGPAIFQIRSMMCVGLLIALSLVEGSLHEGLDARRTGMGATFLAMASSLALLAIGWASIVASSSADPLATSANAFSWLGALLAIAGIGLRGFALRDLGEGFTSAIDPQTKTLVEEGIYGWVRHPSDLGLLMIASGMSWLAGSWVGAALVAGVLLPSIILRVMAEERALSAQFGDAHVRYRDRVGGVLPILGRR